MSTKNFNKAALTTAKGVKAFMASSKTESEWNGNCDVVQEANGGGYPDFWFPTVIMSGLAEETAQKFEP